MTKRFWNYKITNLFVVFIAVITVLKSNVVPVFTFNP